MVLGNREQEIEKREQVKNFVYLIRVKAAIINYDCLKKCVCKFNNINHVFEINN